MSTKLYSSLLCPSVKVTEEQIEADLAVIAMERSVNRLNRRGFLASLAAAGAAAAAAAAGVLGSATPAQAQAALPSIPDVLNFALNLEYLEANLYIAVSGSPALLPIEGAGAPITGLPGKLSLDPQTLATAANLAADERHHIDTLRSAIVALGGTPIAQPALDYSLGGTLHITTEAQFLAVARQFTAVGNSAYAGAAQFLIGNGLVLTVAGQILGAEAQHLGAVNYLCCKQGVLSPPVDATDVPPVPPSQFLTITPPTDPNTPALGPNRTTSQVLGIVYGVSKPTTTTPPSGVTHGGFFPKGVNGAIRST